MPMLRLLGVALCCATTAPALASEEPLDRHIAITGHYTEPDDARNVDYGHGFSVLFGHQLFNTDSRLFLEGLFSSTSLETGVEGFTDFYQYQLGFDLRYTLGRYNGWAPFALLGGGGLYNDVTPDAEDATEPYANAGLGIVSPRLGEWNVQLRGDARYIYDWFADGFGDVRASMGMEIPFSLPPAPPPAAPVPPEIRVIEPPPLPDNDEDGVPDAYDLCKQTPPGAEVNESGCAIGEVLQLRGVKFEFNSARLTANAQLILDSIARTIGYYRDVNAEVAGYTDAVGPDAYNQALSERRAEAVRQYLIEQGIAPSRLTTAGYGEADPLASNETEAGRERNRRVELRIR